MYEFTEAHQVTAKMSYLFGSSFFFESRYQKKEQNNNVVFDET